MRISMRELRSMVSESRNYTFTRKKGVSTPEQSINKHGIQAVRIALIQKFDRVLQNVQHEQDQADIKVSYFVDDDAKEPKRAVTVLVNYVDAVHRSSRFIGSIIIDVRNPFDVFVWGDVANIKNSAERTFFNRLKELLNTEAHPEPNGDLWWADENYYPIRPMVAGEDAKLKPKPTWTIIDDKTGEVIKEADEHPQDARAKLVHPVSRDYVLRDLAKTLGNWRDECNARFDHDMSDVQLYTYKKDFMHELVVQLEHEEGVKSTWEIYFLQNNYAVPLVDAENVFSGYGKKWFKDLSDHVTKELEQLVFFRPQDSGLWWADKDTYELIRPLFIGEYITMPPDPTLVAYDVNKDEEFSSGHQ